MACIMLAEDDHPTRQFIMKALEAEGHLVYEAADGMSAYERLQALSADRLGVSVDLLLTDIVMPGIDGVELSEKAVGLFPDMKVMFITGFSAVAKGMTGQRGRTQPRVLAKPFHLGDLVKQVNAELAA